MGLLQPVSVPLPQDDGFELWCVRVDREMRDRLGTRLSAHPGLPLCEGFECGDSPAEFVTGCVEPYLEELENLATDPWLPVLSPR
jgi:hypothetical protein